MMEVRQPAIAGRTWGWQGPWSLPLARVRLAVIAASLFAVSSASAQTSQQPNAQRSVEPQLSEREQYCQRLERQLAEDWMQANQARETLPDLQGEIRKTDRIFQSAQAKAERSNCYEYFFFSKTVKKTRACVELDRQINTAKRRLAELEAQRQAARGGGRSSSRQDDMIRELARNGCGPQYQQEAKRRQANSGFFNLWDRDSYRNPEPSQQKPNDSSIMPFATYRTLCVRLCDGYYYPVSFSTLPSNFKQDQIECSNRCAAPTELFVHQNPGGSVEQMSSVNGVPYAQIPNAFRFRQEFVSGCSCNVAEYREDGGAGVAAVESSELGPVGAGSDGSAKRRVPISYGTKQANLDADREAPPPLAVDQIPADEGDGADHQAGGSEAGGSEAGGSEAGGSEAGDPAYRSADQQPGAPEVIILPVPVPAPQPAQ